MAALAAGASHTLEEIFQNSTCSGDRSSGGEECPVPHCVEAQGSLRRALIRAGTHNNDV